MRDEATTRGMPAHAARLLQADESVCYHTRPRAIRMELLLTLGAIVAALAVFSAIVEPGFIRLAILPALPLLGAYGGHLLHSPVVFVTRRRVVFAGRWVSPLSVELARLKAMEIKESGLERRLGYGSLLLLVQPIQDLGGTVLVVHELPRLPDARALGAAIASAAAACGVEIVVKDPGADGVRRRRGPLS